MSMNYISTNNEEKNKLLERFVKYVQIWSESDSQAADKGVFPSTPQQFDFARIMKAELEELGLENVQLTKDCYVYGFLPANLPDNTDNTKKEPVLFMAHLDTVDEVTGKNVKPQIAKNPQDYTGDSSDTIVTTDGNTLLGADDKAGIAAIMGALDFLVHNPQIKHGPVEVMFSPDEETGHGMDRVPLNLIKSKCAFTIDGSDLGELESECFNAWAAEVAFTGKSTHTGDARANKMVNAAVMASNFLANLPRHKAPETTDGYQGFIAAMSIEGSIESAKVELLLRAFTNEEIEEEKELIRQLAHTQEVIFGGKAEVTFKKQYINMKEEMDKNPELIKKVEKAYTDAGVPIVRKPIRGGTDGSRLTEMGIPTPNIFNGAHDFHSRNEWLSLNQMSKAADIIINLSI